MTKYVPSNEELQGAIAGVLVEFDGPSPSARNVRKKIETNNPAWRVPPGRRVAKFVKKHEQAVKSSSTISSEDETVADDELSSEMSTPQVTSRRGMLALGASLSVRRLLSGNANKHEPRRELKSKLSFRKKKLAGRRPSLTHAPGHDDRAPAVESPTSNTTLATSVDNDHTINIDDKDVPSFVSDDEGEDTVESSEVTHIDKECEEEKSQVIQPEEKAEEVVNDSTVKEDAQEVVNDAIVQETTDTVAVHDEEEQEKGTVSPGAFVYHDDNDGRVRMQDVCNGCVIL